MNLSDLRKSAEVDQFNESMSAVYSNDDLLDSIADRVEVFTRKFFEKLGLVVDVTRVTRKPYDGGGYESNYKRLNVEASLKLKDVDVGTISTLVSCDKNASPNKFAAWFAYESSGVGSASEVSASFAAAGNVMFNKNFKK